MDHSEDLYCGDASFAELLSGIVDLPSESLSKLSGVVETVTYDSSLIRNYVRAWNTPLNQLNCDQVRRLVGQRGGLDWLAKPVARFVGAYPAAECSNYPGDLSLAATRAHEEMYQHAPSETREMIISNQLWFDKLFEFDEKLWSTAQGELGKALTFIKANH